MLSLPSFLINQIVEHVFSMLQWWDNHLTWTNHGKCMDLTGGDLSDGNQVRAMFYRPLCLAHSLTFSCFVFQIQIRTTQKDNPNQAWDVGYLASNLPYHSQNEQTGYNLCGTGSDQTSLCQTVWIK